MAPLSMTLSDLWLGFQGHDIFWSRLSHGSTQQNHGYADDKAQSPLRITVPAIKRRSPKYAALQTLKRQCYRTHGQITVRFENNHDDVKIHSKRLSELSQFPSISPPFPYIQLRLFIIPPATLRTI